MKSTAALSLLAALAPVLATAIPTQVLHPRASTCEQWGSVVTGDYTIYNNLWNQAAADAGGSQCLDVASLNGDSVAWIATWTWTGGAGQVKSYPNAVYNPSTSSPRQISSMTSMDSSWSWSYTGGGDGLIADVAYDLFTSSSATGSEEFEIMIWLAAIGGAGPISESYGADGSAVSIGSVTIGGVNFSLYKGPNGQMTVYSFVAASQVNDFGADIKDFFDYLVENEGFAQSQYLISAGAGTEPFEGTEATFTTTAFSFEIA